MDRIRYTDQSWGPPLDGPIGWFLHEEDKLGSIEAGKLGDLVVLSGDYFDPRRVADEDIRSVKSVLTVVDGKIVHNATPN